MLNRNRVIAFSRLLLIMPILAWAQTGQVLTLDDCIRIGLKENQSLTINRYETDRSISQAKSNISLVLPSINYSLSSASANAGNTGWNDSYSTSLNLSQNIWDGGRWWNTLKSAQTAQRAADMQLQIYELSTVYQIKVAYYNYLSALKLLDVYRENFNTSQSQHQLTLERFKLGAASHSDTLRTRVSIGESRLKIIQGENEARAKARELNIILGRDGNTPLQLEEPAWSMIEIPKYETTITELIASNPELQYLEETQEISEYNVNISRSAYIPSLNMGMGYSNSAADMGSLYDETTSSLSAGVSLSWNLFNGTQTKRSVEQSKISRKIADENVDLKVRQLKRDLAQALENMETLKESVSISQLILNAAEIDMETAQEEYRLGSMSILDVLTITARYEDAKSGLIQAQYNLKIAEAALHQLLGKR